jgi:predicted GIY-YIG superfamily endonuclease
MPAPHGFWTKKRCAAEARRHKTRSGFAKANSSAYTIAHRKGWLQEICAHMAYAKKPNGFWSLSRCECVAKQFASRAKFRKEASAAYQAAYENGWLNKVCKHMLQARRPNCYWTKKRCVAVAAGCGSAKEFRVKFPGAYDSSMRNGWLESVLGSLRSERRGPKRYWTKELCQAEASKHQRRSHFRESEPGAYFAAHRNGWIDEICAHMKLSGYNKIVYAIRSLEQRSVYIGLTQDIHERLTNHIASGQRYVKEILRGRHEIVILAGPHPAWEAAQEECYQIAAHVQEGWNVVNVARGGALGKTGAAVSAARIAELAKRVTSIAEFKRRYAGAYKRASKLGILTKVTDHISRLRERPHDGAWSLDELMLRASSCSSRSDFKRRHPGAYKAACRLRLLDVICAGPR